MPITDDSILMVLNSLNRLFKGLTASKDQGLPYAAVRTNDESVKVFKNATRFFYTQNLAFQEFGSADFDGYLMLKKDKIQIHFFEFKELNPKENYGQVYIRTDDIDNFYQSLLDRKISIHPNGQLEIKPWNQKEFSILDPDNNLLTFGENM